MRRRIVTLSVLTAVLAITLFGVPLGWVLAQQKLDHERAEVERVADIVGVDVVANLLRGRSESDLRTAYGDVNVSVYDPAGRRVAGSGPAQADDLVRGAGVGRAVTSSLDVDGKLTVAVPVGDGTGPAGVIRAASDWSAARRQIARLWAWMVALAVGAVAATWFIARWQARRLATPVEALARVAQDLGEGDFSIRTTRTGIAEIDDAGAALDTTAERLGDLVTRERAFSADASHQLRTPLTGLRLELETALDLPGDQHRAAMQRAIASADRLEQTIEDLLALARDLEPHGPPTQLPALLADLRATYGPRLAATGRALIVDAPTDVPASRASSRAVRQALGVLLDNAVVHGRGSVTLAARDTPGAVAVEVADEGPGPAAPQEIFQRGAAGTRGHGLALARKLVEAEGGRLLLAQPSPPVFRLLLPPLADDS